MALGNSGSKTCKHVAILVKSAANGPSPYQSINPVYLSTVSAPTDPTHRKPIDDNTGYVLSYSHRDPDISALYKSLDDANNRYIDIRRILLRRGLPSFLALRPRQNYR